MTLKAPFPYFGGKRQVARAVWKRFGVVRNYVEPFFGSGAVLLGRPDEPGIETVNDLDGFIANFWRAVAVDPEAVARYVDWPVNETDLIARHMWLIAQRGETTRRLEAAPDWYDARIAGWWCWGACNWIGTGWCSGVGSWIVDDGQVQQMPRTGQGVNRKLPHQLPHLGNAGRGVNRKLPHLGNAGRGRSADWSAHLRDMMQQLSDRLRRVRVACGDWQRICTPSVTHIHGLTAVFLDPPYGEGAMEYASGGNADASVTSAVRAWCEANGDNPLLRIAYCGYDVADMPHGWTAHRWTAQGGYSIGNAAGNRTREIIWFSPHCIQPATHHEQLDIFNAAYVAGERQ